MQCANSARGHSRGSRVGLEAQVNQIVRLVMSVFLPSAVLYDPLLQLTVQIYHSAISPHEVGNFAHIFAGSSQSPSVHRATTL